MMDVLICLHASGFSSQTSSGFLYLAKVLLAYRRKCVWLASPHVNDNNNTLFSNEYCDSNFIYLHLLPCNQNPF